MQKSIEFFLTSLFDETCATVEELDDSVILFCNLLSYIKDKEDTLSIPSEFYEEELISGVGICDYLYSNDHYSDVREILLEHMKEIKICDLTYNEIFNLLEEENQKSYQALVGIKDNYYIKGEQLYVNQREKWINPHRHYLSRSNSLKEFKDNLNKCFPDLIFHDRVSSTINIFNKIEEHIEELIRHLSVLNDYGAKLCQEIGYSTGEIFKRLEAEYNIISSGRGSNEGLNMFLCKFKNDQGEFEEIRCNPHTKLYTKYSEYRIYFNWGRASIGNGKILIGHVGGHWKD